MTLQEQMKTVILAQYKNLRTFSIEEDIPYSTIHNILDRSEGLNNATVKTMLKICSALNLDIESIATGTLRYKDPSYRGAVEVLGKDVIEKYKLLNRAGRERILSDLDILVESEKYTISGSDNNE